MMNTMMLDTQTMVGVTVLSAMVILAVGLSIRAKLTRKPVRVPVEARRR